MAVPARGLAAALVLGALGGCCFFAESPTRSVSAPPPGAAPARPPGEPSLRVLLFSDLGDETCQRDEVASRMARATRREPFDLALSAGDNIQTCGPDPTLPGAEGCAFGPDDATVDPAYAPPADPIFQGAFEDGVAGLRGRGGGRLPVYLVLGNHDVRSDPPCAAGKLSAPELGRRRACLEVARRTEGWRMPGRHYALDAGPARFVAVDSNLLVADYGGFSLDGELAFAAEATAGCGARPCFLLLHHPPASAGSHGLAVIPERLAALEGAVAGRAGAWIAGHDHDLQHLRTPSGADVLVVGNTSRGRSGERFERVEPGGAALLFGSVAWGWAALEVWDSGAWAARFEDVRGRALHCCRSDGAAGPCTPAECD